VAVDLDRLEEDAPDRGGMPLPAREADGRVALAAGGHHAAEHAHRLGDVRHPLGGAGAVAVGVDDAERHVDLGAPVEGDGDVGALGIHRDELDARPCGFSANDREASRNSVVNC
jgi:hypothetical protein